MANPRFFPVLSDHLGAQRKVLDGQTGETRWAWDAKEPFGFELPNELPTAGLAAFSFDLRFPGQRADPETGLFQNGFRNYHPGLGRYVESDPLGLEAGWNTYAYTSSNPLAFIDPTGLSQKDLHLMQAIMDAQIRGMVARGERSAFLGMYSGRINASYNNLFGYSVCSVQSASLFTALENTKENGGFDDHWVFNVMNSPTHFWIDATSDNPLDPKIRLDPWRGSINRRDVPSIFNTHLYLFPKISTRGTP